MGGAWKNNRNLESDRGRTTVGGRGEEGRKDECKRRGELARQRANVTGRRSQRNGVAEEEGGAMGAGGGALLRPERAIRTEREGKEEMEWKIVIRKIEVGWLGGGRGWRWGVGALL